MDAHIEPIGFLEDRLQAARALGRRDLDSVLRAVRESFLRVRQVVQVALGQAGRAEERANLHAAILRCFRLRRWGWRRGSCSGTRRPPTSFASLSSSARTNAMA